MTNNEKAHYKSLIKQDTEHRKLIKKLQLEIKKLSLGNVSNCTEIEAPYFDKTGKQIKEFAVIKIFHFKGVNEQGRGRKNYYMYKWVRLTESNGKKWWTALHLSNDSGDYFHLRSTANSKRIMTDTEIVQQH